MCLLKSLIGVKVYWRIHFNWGCLEESKLEHNYFFQGSGSQGKCSQGRLPAALWSPSSTLVVVTRHVLPGTLFDFFIIYILWSFKVLYDSQAPKLRVVITSDHLHPLSQDVRRKVFWLTRKVPVARNVTEKATLQK